MTTPAEKPANLSVPRPRPSLIWLAVLVLLVAAPAYQGVRWLAAGLMAPEHAIGGPFSLLDTSGSQVTEAALAGKPYAIFFGYTHCPDVCPTTLQDMTSWLAALGPDADKLRLVFVTVDPARDTVPVLKDYMTAFDPRILALTGNPANIAAMLAAYRVYARKVDDKAADYAMDHTAITYLMTGKGELKTVLSYTEKQDAALQHLKELIHGG
jgi:protein SCO1/2